MSVHLHQLRARASYLAMCKFLAKGGIDITTFDSRGKKTLRDLHREVQERDVKLLRDVENRVIRFALSIKILIRSGDEVLLETSRTYAGGIVRKLKEWSLSETRKSDELPLQTALRGLREELGLEIAPDKLQLFESPPRLDRHESSVYPGLISHVLYDMYFLELPREFKNQWRDEKIVKEGGTEVRLVWARRP